MRYGLKDHTIKKINEIFAHFPEVEEAVLYGSRAKGTHRPGSDIDLTLKGQIDLRLLNRIAGELDDLLLPYTFDLSIYDHIEDRDLIDHIRRVGVVFYEKEYLSPNAANRLPVNGQHQPEISKHLLWEYDLETFNYDRSRRVVIERVIERGTLVDWREIYRYFGKEIILNIAKSSRQLSERDKSFTEIFVNSSLIYAT